MSNVKCQNLTDVHFSFSHFNYILTFLLLIHDFCFELHVVAAHFTIFFPRKKKKYCHPGQHVNMHHYEMYLN